PCTTVGEGEMMAEPEPSDEVQSYSISVQVPEEVLDGRVTPREYLDELADHINQSDDVHIKHDDSVPLRRDSSGYWADATMTIYYSIGCATKRSEDGDDD